MAIVVDGFIDEAARLSLLDKLPSLETAGCRALPTVMAPELLEASIRSVVEGAGQAPGSGKQPLSFADDEPMVPLPARVARGSVPPHKDCFNPFDAADHMPIDGYVAILYLAGAGKLVIDAGGGEQSVEVAPGRLVAWPNGDCYHRFDAPPGAVRAMVGPLAIDADGYTRRAHDVWSTHPGYIGFCRSQAAEAEQGGEHEAALRAIRNIGIPAVAQQLEQEYMARRKAKRKFVVVTLTITSTQLGPMLVGTALAGDEIFRLPISQGDTLASMKETILEHIPGTQTDNTDAGFVLEGGELLDDAKDDIPLMGLIRGEEGQGEDEAPGDAGGDDAAAAAS